MKGFLFNVRRVRKRSHQLSGTRARLHGRWRPLRGDPVRCLRWLNGPQCLSLPKAHVRVVHTVKLLRGEDYIQQGGRLAVRSMCLLGRQGTACPTLPSGISLSELAVHTPANLCPGCSPHHLDRRVVRWKQNANPKRKDPGHSKLPSSHTEKRKEKKQVNLNGIFSFHPMSPQCHHFSISACTSLRRQV